MLGRKSESKAPASEGGRYKVIALIREREVQCGEGCDNGGFGAED